MGALSFARGAYAVRGHFIKSSPRYLCGKLFGGASVPVKRSKQCSRDSSLFHCYQLSHRTLVQIRGQDTNPFLQGIITNDMGLLEERRAMYAHMLNVQGRTQFDILLYSLKDDHPGHGVLLECDSSMKDSIVKHLKTYSIRRKINVDSGPELCVWAVLPQQNQADQVANKPELSSSEQVHVWEADPRTQKMGWRLVLDNKVDPTDVIASCRQADVEDYHKHRYTIGLPEGVKDLPPGVALPLESNLVFMEGISFSKGCYIGQELTARTHHTGVIRKRLMPVRLSAPVKDLEEGAPLLTQSGKPAGKHRGTMGELGLCLIRIAHAKEVLTLKCADTTITLEASIPDWWPQST